MTKTLKDTSKNTVEEKNSKIVDAFKSYEWIVLHTNPIYDKLYLDDLAIPIPVPDYIKDDVNKLKFNEYNPVRSESSYYLDSVSINNLLIKLTNRGIPLYKVNDKEISSMADIRQLWDVTGLSSRYNNNPFGLRKMEIIYNIKAYLNLQRLEILKKLKAKKQDTSQDTPDRQNVSTTQLDDWSVIDNKREVYWNGISVTKLANIPYKLFVCLLKKKGKFVKTKTLEKCWDTKPDYDKFLIDMMNKLEAKLNKELTKKGINYQGKIFESKKNDNRKIIAYKLSSKT